MTTKRRDDVAYAVRLPNGAWDSWCDESEWKSRVLYTNRKDLALVKSTVVKVTRRKAVRLSKEARLVLGIELNETAHDLVRLGIGSTSVRSECIAWLEEMLRRLEE